MTIIEVRKCTACFTRILSIKMIICVVRTAWCSIRRWISRIVGVTCFIIRGTSPFMIPSIIPTFFIKKFKCKKENNHNRNCSCSIQVKLPNKISTKTRNPQGNKNRLENPQEYLFKKRWIFSFSAFNVISIIHRVILAIQYDIISKIPLINQKIWRLQ